MCTMALILLGLALIPFTDSKQPRTLPLRMPNTHVSELSYNWALCVLAKVSTKSCI
jgi:hypothetical protein